MIGIHLEGKKDASLLNWTLKRPFPPEKVRIVLPFASSPCVRVQESVEFGQKIAEPEGEEGVAAYASLSGTVEKIAPALNAFGKEALTLEIRRHGEPKTHTYVSKPRKNWENLPLEESLKILKDAGLVSMDRLMEPLHVKIRRSRKAKPGKLILNGCEPEPYVTCEHLLTTSHPVEILKGAELLRVMTGAEKICMLIEENKSEVLELVKSKIYFLKWNHFEVKTFPAIYPLDLREIFSDNGSIPVFSPSEAFAVYEAVALQKPFYERIVTVAGECIVEPRNLWLPLGISLRDAIQACKGVMREPHKVIMGGPMSGFAQKDLEPSVLAGTDAVLALPKEIAQSKPEEPCIRCGKCAEVCPASISPAMITLAIEHKVFDAALVWGLDRCTECGNCHYICPSQRPMLKLLRSVIDQSEKAVPKRKSHVPLR